MTKIIINSDRLLKDLHSLRSFGCSGTGVIRPAFSAADISARHWLIKRIKAAGLTAKVDPAGNVFGLPPSSEKALLLGSHSDSQPQGGWLDGAYGVITALEIARASLECGGPPIAMVSFQDEEGRFSTLTGSKLFSGALTLSDADKLTDITGTSFSQARLSMADICQSEFIDPKLFSGFIEAHIEQGIVLDQANQDIGVVDSIVGINNEKFSFFGQQNHAGTTPMQLRRDAFQGLVRFTTELNLALADIVTDSTVWTIGHVQLHPNAASIIPGRVDFNLQWRDASDKRLTAMRKVIHNCATRISTELELGLEHHSFSSVPATVIDPQLMDQISSATAQLATDRWRHMPSGALHDASNLSSVMPVAMLFIPSIDGISHDFAEDTAIRHLILGAQVLAASVSR